MHPVNPTDSNEFGPERLQEPTPPTEDAFDRYFAGMSSPNEAFTVRSYINRQYPRAVELLANPGTAYITSKLGPEYTPPRGNSNLVEVDAMWARVIERLAESTLPKQPLAANARIRSGPGAGRAEKLDSSATKPWFHRITTAAKVGVLGFAVIIGFAIPAAIYMGGENIPSGSTEVQTKTIVTNAGQRVTYHLPDGSSAILAPGSRLSYPANFGSRGREVVLDGEALFTVTQNKGTPFVVRHGQTSVRVLGTTFSVRRYDSDSALTVVVAEGKVSVASEVLTSGDVAYVGTNGTVNVARATDISAALSWTTGRLTFRRTALRDVIPQMERWYNLKITVADPEMLDQPITGSFLTDASIGAVNSIALLLHADVVRHGNHVSLIARNVSNPAHSE